MANFDYDVLIVDPAGRVPRRRARAQWCWGRRRIARLREHSVRPAEV